jgi:putative drug exporter of the RND superfamily
MFSAIGRFSYHYKWVVIAVWVVLFGVSVVATPFLEGVLTGGFSNPNAPSQEAAALIQEKFQQGPTQVLVVFKSDSLQATGEEFGAAEKKALDGLAAASIPGLLSIQTYANTGSTQLISKDGFSSVAVLNFSTSSQDVQGHVDQIRAAIKSDTLTTYLTGEPAIFSEISSYSFRDLRKVEIYGLPVALIALIFVFGSLVAAALPVITGGIAVTVTLGAMWVVGSLTSMSIFSMNIATLLGLAVAIDYALFIVNRFREELHRGASVKDAVVVTTARAGRSVFFSGAAVLVGVVGLIFFPSPGIRSLGIGGAIVVFMSVAASVTFMPALLAALGHKVNSIPVVRLHEAHNSRRWKWWAGLLLKRPWAAIIAAVILGSAIAIPATWMNTQMTSSKTLPPAAESRQGIEILDTEFDREALSPISVLLTWDGDGAVDVGRAFALFTYGQQLMATPGVTSVLSPFTLQGLSDPTALVGLWPQFEKMFNDPDNYVPPAEGITVGDVTVTADQLNQFKTLVKASIAPGAVLFRVTSANPPDSSVTYGLVDTLMAITPPSGYQSHVGGEAAWSRDFLNELNYWLPWVVIWIVFTSLLVFAVLLKSVVLPVLAVLVNLFTIAMSFGWLVIFFQGPFWEKILRFTSTGGIDAINRVVMLCVLFGITMDYAVFMLTRMHERWLRTGNNREAVNIGVVRTGRIIVSAALLVVIVTGAFTFTNIATTKMLGLGIALAIVADTILVRLILLPAVMVYLGKANWWWPSIKVPWPRRKGAGVVAAPVIDDEE